MKRQSIWLPLTIAMILSLAFMVAITMVYMAASGASKALDMLNR